MSNCLVADLLDRFQMDKKERDRVNNICFLQQKINIQSIETGSRK